MNFLLHHACNIWVINNRILLTKSEDTLGMRCLIYNIVSWNKQHWKSIHIEFFYVSRLKVLQVMFKVTQEKRKLNWNFYNFSFIFFIIFPSASPKKQENFLLLYLLYRFFFYIYFLLLGCHYSIVTIIILIFHPIYGIKIKKKPPVPPHSTQTQKLFIFSWASLAAFI